MRRRWRPLATLAALVVGGAAAEAPIEDAETGLVKAPGWKLVEAHCGGCHSYQLFTTQRGDEQFWADVIRWMQRTQNLWAIPVEQERTMIGYLADAYAESDWGRRPPLPALLMPQLE